MGATNVPPQGNDGQQQMAMPGMPPEVQAMLAQVLQGGGSADQYGIDPEALGGYFDPDFFGEREVPGMRGAVPAQVPTTINRPHYKQGDEWRMLQSLPPERFRRLQERMHVVGLLDEFRPGQFDPSGSTIKAAKTLLTMANRSGNNWDGLLTSLETAVANGSMEPLNASGQTRTVPEFTQIPDYATLHNKVRRSMNDLIGRDPTEAEMRMFTDEMLSDYQTQATQDMEAQTSTRDLDPNVGAGHQPTQQRVNPMERFEMALRERMAGDIQTVERQAGTQSGAQSAAANIAASDRITGA